MFSVVCNLKVLAIFTSQGKENLAFVNKVHIYIYIANKYLVKSEVIVCALDLFDKFVGCLKTSIMTTNTLRMLQMNPVVKTIQSYSAVALPILSGNKPTSGARILCHEAK